MQNKWEPQKLEAWLITPNGDKAPFEILGEEIPRNKLDPAISSGYMYYFKTTEGLKKYSAFNYIIERVDNV